MKNYTTLKELLKNETKTNILSIFNEQNIAEKQNWRLNPPSKTAFKTIQGCYHWTIMPTDLHIKTSNYSKPS